MKIFLILSIALSYFVSNESSINELNNDNIKYDVYLQTLNGDGLTFQYNAELSNEKLNSELFKMTKNELKFILDWYNDEKKDWAANILLYARFSKDVESLDFYPEDVWRKLKKDEDLHYWEKILK